MAHHYKNAKTCAGANSYFVGPLEEFFEVGYEISYVDAGVTFKFGSKLQRRITLE